jgi:DNA repair protein RadD
LIGIRVYVHMVGLMSPSLRYYQQEALDAIFDYWSENEGNPLVDMATGTGKGLALAALTQRLKEGWPKLRIMCITHVVELVTQDLQELYSIWPFPPAGVYAASLGRREPDYDIVFAQLQTVWNKAAEIGHIDVLEIDEVHLVPADANTMYGKLIAALRAINPDMKIVGFTATPYRLDSGRLDEGDDRLFDKVVYTYGIAQGIADGYLTALSSKGMQTGFDLSGVGTLGGDYKKGALATAVDKDEVTRAAVAEAIAYGRDKRTALFFCSGIDHAHHVRDEVRRLGKSCETIHGMTPAAERRRILEDFKSGVLWGVTNDAVLTTGTNVPGIDMIADLAPTKSCSRFVQKAGRGTRVVYAPGYDLSTAEGRIAAIAAGPKPTCLYLDYARNVAYHGPVDKVEPRKPGKGGEAPIKQCPQCDEILPISIMQCSCCGHEFPPSEDVKITERAASAPILSTEGPKFHAVHSRRFAYHDKIGGTPSVKVTYGTDAGSVSEWICPQHTGFAKSKADRYWSLHKGSFPFPKSVDEFLDRAGELRVTAEVQIKFGAKYPEIVGHRAGEAMGEAAPANDNAGGGNLSGLLRPRRAYGSAPANNWADMDDDIPFARNDQ